MTQVFVDPDFQNFIAIRTSFAWKRGLELVSLLFDVVSRINKMHRLDSKMEKSGNLIAGLIKGNQWLIVP